MIVGRQSYNQSELHPAPDLSKLGAGFAIAFLPVSFVYGPLGKLRWLLTSHGILNAYADVTAARAIETFIRGRTFDDYRVDLLLRSAVEWQIEIIGEAAARSVSEDFRQAHAEIGQRHVLAHGDGAIQHDRVWRVATEQVPNLIELLEPLVPPPP